MKNTIKYKEPVALTIDLADGSRIVGTLEKCTFYDDMWADHRSFNTDKMSVSTYNGGGYITVVTVYLGMITLDANYITGLATEKARVNNIEKHNAYAVLQALDELVQDYK